MIAFFWILGFICLLVGLTWGKTFFLILGSLCLLKAMTQSYSEKMQSKILASVNARFDRLKDDLHRIESVITKTSHEIARTKGDASEIKHT